MSEKLADSSEYRHGNMVFFDVLGVVVVAYPARVGTILNYMVATAAFLYLAKKASLPGNGGRAAFPVVDVSPLVVSILHFTQTSGVLVLFHERTTFLSSVSLHPSSLFSIRWPLCS